MLINLQNLIDRLQKLVKDNPGSENLPVFTNQSSSGVVSTVSSVYIHELQKYDETCECGCVYTDEGLKCGDKIINISI